MSMCCGTRERERDRERESQLWGWNNVGVLQATPLGLRACRSPGATNSGPRVAKANTNQRENTLTRPVLVLNISSS